MPCDKVKSHKFEVLGTKRFISNLKESELQGGRHKVFNTRPLVIIFNFYLLYICFGCVKEMSQ